MKNCPVCGSDQLLEVVRPELFQYQGHSKTIEDYRSIECQKCGEVFATEESLKRSEPVLRDLQRMADHLLTSSQIRQVRESLGYTQDDFGMLLGGGKKAFARYERGTVTQARSMDNLLRVLKAYPEALSVLQSERQESVMPPVVEENCVTFARTEWSTFSPKPLIQNPRFNFTESIRTGEAA